MALDVMGMGNAALSMFVLMVVLLFVVALVGITTYFILKGKRFNEYKVIIYSEDGLGQIIQKNDSGGIFVDSKTKNKRFFIKGAKVGLEADNFPYLMGNKGQKTVYLLQTGLKNFRFIKINIDIPKVELKVGEEDVNWALNDFDRSLKMFSTDKLMQYMPYIIIAFVSIFILVLFIYFFKDFDKLVTMSANFKEAMMYGAQAAANNAGTQVIGG